MKVGDPPRRWSPGLWGVAVPSDTPPPWAATNGYLIGGAGTGWLVDPGGAGADADAAIDALLAAAGTRTLKGVLLTHTHRDHWAGVAGVLRRHGRVDVLVHPLGLARLPATLPARPLPPGRRLVAGTVVLEALDTPGHASDHLAFWLPEDRALLAGDLVAGRGSSWVGLPDGDVARYLETLMRVAELAPILVAPAHGPPRVDGRRVLDEAHAHRLGREREVWAALATGPRTLTALRDAVYPGLDPRAHDLAERSLLAHLRKLMRERRVLHLGTDEGGPFAQATGA